MLSTTYIFPRYTWAGTKSFQGSLYSRLASVPRIGTPSFPQTRLYWPYSTCYSYPRYRLL